jgi:hypothetical protein
MLKVAQVSADIAVAIFRVNTYWLGILEECCVFFEIHTEFLRIIWMSFSFKGLTLAQRLLIKIFNKRGPRIETYGTPDNTEKREEKFSKM